MKYSGIGGQAVIEGIMMMKGEDYAVAVRRPDKEIEVKKDTYQSITKKAKILQLPFVRGVFRFADSMIIGMRSLTYSASFFEDDEDAEPGKFEQFLDRLFWLFRLSWQLVFLCSCRWELRTCLRKLSHRII